MTKRKYSEYRLLMYVLNDLILEYFENIYDSLENSSTIAKEFAIKNHKEIKAELINPPKKFQTVATLRQMESDMLIYFNESDYAKTESFWNDVASLGLPFRRNDVVGKVLKRGKIRSRAEYETIVDLIVPYSQEGKITAEDVTRLNEMIGKFEELRTH